MGFKIGDSVKIKEGIILQDLKEISKDHWQGRIIDIEEGDKGITVELDSICLKTLEKDYLPLCIEKETVIFNLHLNPEQIELAPERDKAEDIEKTQDELDLAYMEATESSATDDYSIANKQKNILRDKWIRHFTRSPFFKEMGKRQQGNVHFLLGIFSDYMLDYQNESPTEWTAFSTRDICLSTFPKKVSADKETFEDVGIVFPQFFEFLASRNYLENAIDLKDTVLEIKDEIVELSQDRSNWGPAKTFFTGAEEAGVNMNSQEEMDAYLFQQQQKKIAELAGNEGKVLNELFNLIPDLETKLGRIPRNKKVTVEYKDGTIKENILYKKVQKDVKSGKCKITKV